MLSAFYLTPLAVTVNFLVTALSDAVEEALNGELLRILVQQSPNACRP